MPSIYSKPNLGLGSAFGGDISSLNFNFQTGGESSSATITIFNENNSYQEPSLGEKINLYPWNIGMTVMEFGLVDDGNYKFLQVELVDSLSEVLDKNLITIRGIHSTGTTTDKVNENLYYWFENSALPTGATSNRVLGNTFFKGASSDTGIRKVSDYAWLLGRIRATYRPTGEIFWNNGTASWNPSESPIWIKWEGGQLRSDLSKWKGGMIQSSDLYNLLKEEGVSNVEYGYTLSDLKSLLIKLGLKVEDNNVMSDNRVLFSTSGSVRTCLSSCLSAIGRTFYVDPRSKVIKIISNADISKINSSLVTRIATLSQLAGAEQVSYVKSLRGIIGRHIVVKGDLQNHIFNPSQFENVNKPRKAVFKRVPIDGLFTQELDPKEYAFIRKVLYLIGIGVDESVIDKYLYALAQLEETAEWSTETLLSKVLYGRPHVEASEMESVNSGGRWQEFVTENIATIDNLDGYSLSKTVGARPLIREGTYDDTEPLAVQRTHRAISGSRAGLYEFLRGINQLWAGIYISRPTSLDRINKRNYLDAASYGGKMGGQPLSLTFVRVAADSYLSEIPELSFLQQAIVKGYPTKSDLKISDLATAAGYTSSADSWHTLAFRTNFIPETEDDLQIGNLSKYINRNFYLVETPDSSEPTLWLLYTSLAANVVTNVRRICEESFDNQIGTTKSKVTVLYDLIKTDNSREDDGEDESDVEEQPKILSLKTIPTEIDDFERGELIFINGDYLETSLFLEEMDEISPQTNAPLLSSEIKFYRAPIAADVDVESGVDSVTVSAGDDGVSTTVRYSSLKYNEIDQSIIVDYLGRRNSSQKTINAKQRVAPAFIRNEG